MIKAVISDPKSGRSKGMELDEAQSTAFLNRRIGEQVDGAALGMSGYKLKITGGSDSSGFPMDRSVEGPVKRQVLKLVARSGREKGQHRRSTVRGNVVSAETAQVNLSVQEYGDRSIEEILGPAKEKAPVEKKAV